MLDAIDGASPPIEELGHNTCIIKSFWLSVELHSNSRVSRSSHYVANRRGPFDNLYPCCARSQAMDWDPHPLVQGDEA